MPELVLLPGAGGHVVNFSDLCTHDPANENLSF